GDGGLDESGVLKVIGPEIDEPAEVCTTRSVTSVPSTTTGSVPNSPSTHHGERPRSARMMYCPGGTFGNSNVPSSLSRAPIEMLTGDDDRTLESSVRLPGFAGWPPALRTLPAMRAVRAFAIVMSTPARTCAAPSVTNCAPAGFAVPG